ncbi:hypothetical protein [Kordia sp.]|uniref:hypothetical protein n=1 Tax=Kordia sp. TaxID=1965332 RepID=UPI0025BB240F|nr:hypothetical protein [Kordia sp.]MCH2197053.1 hypothetical protein [Kordia sp.]
MKLDTTSYFLLLTFGIFCLGIISNGVLGAESLYVNSLADQFTQGQIAEILNFKQKWQWVGYLFIPILLLIKVSIIALVLDIGLFFFGEEMKYKTIFRAVVKAEFIFLGVIVIKTLWLYCFVPNYTLVDIQNFYPLSVLTFVNYENIASWLVYPLQTLNLFEVLYWFFLAYLISKQIKQSIGKGFSIVASSYGVSLVIWVTGMIFLSLHLS